MSIKSSKLRFSGHQTFPPRYGWIYKTVQEVNLKNSISSQNNIEQQMVSMGIGKNMVLSCRHWIKCMQLVVTSPEQDIDFELTSLAKKIFLNNNLHDAYDEYLDKIGTMWLLHWLMQSIPVKNPEINSARWFFNYYNGIQTSKELMQKEILASLQQHKLNVSTATLKKDIDCFFLTYANKHTHNHKINEDSFTSPFNELDLIQQIDTKSYISELTNRKSLPNEIFAFAMIDYINSISNKEANSSTISFQTLLNGIGSPGRIFRLSSDGLSERLDTIEGLTQGAISWTDTQGLRQIQCNHNIVQSITPDDLLVAYYQSTI